MAEQKTKEQAIKDYGAESIRVLEGLEAVRKRPAMYIGSTGKDGLHHLVYEVVDNAIDEAQAGYCNLINITINKDDSIVIEDNGRGIPVEKHATGKSAMEVALTKLHAGGKFDKKSYQISGGLHGVGVSVVNALSKKMIAQSKRNNKIFEQVYKNGGKPEGNVKEVRKTEGTGTIIQFWPDPEIFTITTKFDYDVLTARFRELAFLNPGVKITLKDERDDKKTDFFSTEGLMEFIKWLNRSKNALHKPVYFKKDFDHSTVEVAIQYNEGYNEGIFGFVNTINTVEGGTHISGLKTALTRVINDYAKKNKMMKNISVQGDDVREGLIAIISLKIPNPQFEGQTKTKLGNSEIKGFVDSIVTTALSEFFEQNPAIAKKIVQKCSSAAEAREAARKARELVRRKTAMSIGGLPGKLADCSSNKLDETELFIVEGESAAGSGKQARDKEFQAVLPLKGKILNVEKASPTKVFSSDEIVNLITAIGTGTGETFNIEKLRYGKTIIMTDADVDGQHIKTLLLTLFFRYVPQLIEAGRVFVAVAPLYRIKKGNESHYVYSDEELKKKIEKLGGKPDVQRFKGLGEMNPQQLWETTMNPKERSLKKIKIEDAVEADNIFSMLMGDEVGPRREFIESHAKMAELDI